MFFWVVIDKHTDAIVWGFSTREKALYGIAHHARMYGLEESDFKIRIMWIAQELNCW
jgi:hypothetical protein